jgi:uncharacterized Zn-binding protein involved in type VI secretion
MAGVSRVNTDTAGGLITGALVSSVYVNGSKIAVQGAAVASHGQNEHGGAVMVGCSSTVFAGGIGVCRQGDNASCGHTSTGSSNVNAG